MLNEALANANKAITLMQKGGFFGTRHHIYKKLAEEETDSTKKTEYQKLADADMAKYNQLWD